MYLVGIDEVGRGALAGPLVVGAVVLNQPISGLRDSKVLSRKQRTVLNELIIKSAKYVGLGWVSSKELDAIGLSQALTLAATRALSDLNLEPIRYILDGNYNYLSAAHTPFELIIKGDALVPAISAASIVAKVARDNYMFELDKELPEYGFKNHVGYGTKEHLNAIVRSGASIEHRKSFEPLKSQLSSDGSSLWAP